MEYYLIFSVPQALLFWFLHFPLQLSKSTLSPDGVEEILDTRLVGTCNPEEVRSLARIAHQCLHKTPFSRSSFAGYFKDKKRRLIKESNKVFCRRFIGSHELDRISRMARIDEGLNVWSLMLLGRCLRILMQIWYLEIHELLICCHKMWVFHI